ncbi:MAG: RagB/SusD family nutrient uptake outer membrane protein, partial [Bacteroidetes bacterium]|nr:RagB/SusD family nutrient uptake outer membrane protein [Bacteroidota bacterium]
FSDSATAMTAVAAAYSYPNGSAGDFGFSDGMLTVIAGLSADETGTTLTDANTVSIYNYTLNADNVIVPNLWNVPYSALYTVNAILKNVDASTTLSASFKKQILAEMKVLRALYYFNLVNQFGGVPLVTSTDQNVTATLPRATADEIYNQVLKDLTEAQQALPATYPSAGKARPNLYTATAFLAKVRLYRQEWQAAYDAANAVIGSNVYNVETDLNNVFLDGSKEAIWQLPANYNNTNYYVNEAGLYIPYTTGVTPSYPVTPWLMAAFEAGDQRSVKWITSAVVGAQTYYYPYKYKNRQYTNPTTEDYMIFRLGEQYLIRAEAAAHLNNLSGALADLNKVRARAGLSASTASPTSQTAILDAIMHERQTELFCEWGNRWFDLKRTGTAAAVLSAEKSNWKQTVLLYPIPNSQIKLNYRLTQNPGYN